MERMRSKTGVRFCLEDRRTGRKDNIRNAVTEVSLGAEPVELSFAVMDKSWIIEDRTSDAYNNRVEQFLRFDVRNEEKHNEKHSHKRRKNIPFISYWVWHGEDVGHIPTAVLPSTALMLAVVIFLVYVNREIPYSVTYMMCGEFEFSVTRWVNILFVLHLPAQIAGCKSVVLATPPGKDGSICKVEQFLDLEISKTAAKMIFQQGTLFLLVEALPKFEGSVLVSIPHRVFRGQNSMLAIEQVPDTLKSTIRTRNKKRPILLRGCEGLLQKKAYKILSISHEVVMDCAREYFFIAGEYLSIDHPLDYNGKDHRQPAEFENQSIDRDCDI
ncbi:hypothetical protein C5167_031469 [Papaver somniferum]|uniref:Uncharacterized protein n=1 Tax=Papaver somniferum TaxID=3469 RepID=A0A4Y7K5W0_PAPSO|nr:hypothetical protein C5167_031469 [Papaver somniferum]